LDFAVDTNIKGPFWLVQACLPHLKKAKDGGRIVLISAAAVCATAPTLQRLHTTKAGVNGLSMTLANELARFKITSNVVEPGVTNSATFAKNFGPDEIKAAEAIIPLGRISQPHDIGHACLFFCLPRHPSSPVRCWRWMVA